MKVVFVCTGNTCRSPMAEHLFRDMLLERGVTDVDVVSAGISAREGSPPAMQTASILEQQGIQSIQSHQSQPISSVDLEAGDLVLTMTEGHKRYLSHLPDDVTVKTLKEYVGEGGNVSDPIGRGEEAYREVFEQIKPILEDLADQVANEETSPWEN